MSKTVDVSRECSFQPPIDITAVLNHRGIQFLEVHDRRAIVIFANAILNLECFAGTLTALERAELSVYDLPPNGNTDSETATEAGRELLEDFRSQLTEDRPSVTSSSP